MPRLSAHGHYYNLRRDTKDRRDHVYQVPYRYKLDSLPERVDYRDAMPEVWDQGAAGSCAGQAQAAMIQHQRKKLNHVDFTPSRLFMYYNARRERGWENEDSGCTLRDMQKASCEVGAPPEMLWSYYVGAVTAKPSPAAYIEALNWQVLSYTRVNQTLAQMLPCLTHIGPFVAGLQIYESFESTETRETGIVKIPKRGWWRGEKKLGGHAVCIVGFDRDAEMFILRNSWGVDWGKKGYAEIPFDYLLDSALAMDFWVVKTVE